MSFRFKESKWEAERADKVTAADVRAYNTFDEPYKITEKEIKVCGTEIKVPSYSVIRMIFKKA